jgi:hypothetical protein
VALERGRYASPDAVWRQRIGEDERRRLGGGVDQWRQPIGKWRYFTDLGFHLLPLAHRKRTTMKGDASSRRKTSYAGEYVFCLKYSAPHVESPTVMELFCQQESEKMLSKSNCGKSSWR